MIGFVLAATAIFDIRDKEIPFRLLYTATILVLVQVFIRLVDKELTVQDSIMTLLPGIFLFITARISGKVGYADAWIVSLIGLTQGLADCFVILTLGLILCGVYAAVLLAFRKVKAKTQIAFIPFMLTAFFIIHYLK
ncbi:MAG: hypothetical protein LBM60_05260 [Clostridium sp.]|jgi:prepilin signal peptidase PulO-like enzyme (type II secretory pathway)|nr:hypothetical protein [Clostridium sp.]